MPGPPCTLVLNGGRRSQFFWSEGGEMWPIVQEETSPAREASGRASNHSRCLSDQSLCVWWAFAHIRAHLVLRGPPTPGPQSSALGEVLLRSSRLAGGRLKAHPCSLRRWPPSLPLSPEKPLLRLFSLRAIDQPRRWSARAHLLLMEQEWSEPQAFH